MWCRAAGLLHSKDDFLSSPTLYVAETTNMVANETMRQWNRDHSNETAMSWQRSMVATGWATSGKHWTELFSRENSGTYNNQWMVRFWRQTSLRVDKEKSHI